MPKLEGAITTALISEIENQLISFGIAAEDLEVSRSNQPTAQYMGAYGDAAKYQVFLSPVTKSKINAERTNSINSTDLTANYTHILGTSYQIECLTNFEPGSDNYVAVDLLGILSNLMQHYDAISNLKKLGVFVESCGAIRPSYTIMDQGLHESTPSFDLKLTYNSKFAKLTPSTSTVTGTIEGL